MEKSIFRFPNVFCAVTSMGEIALFGEDFAHRQIIDALVRRIAADHGVAVRMEWRNATGGHGQVVKEFERYIADLRRQPGSRPDLIVVTTDANCVGFQERAKQFDDLEVPAPMVRAIPDPHIERWLLLDSAAFKSALGRGCDAPDLKCERNRYKQLLRQAVRDAGIEPSLGGVEFAGDIVGAMDLARAARADKSFQRFAEELARLLRQ